MHHDGNPGAAIAFDYSAIKGRPTSSISFMALIEISCCLEVPQTCVGMDLNLAPCKVVDLQVEESMLDNFDLLLFEAAFC